MTSNFSPANARIGVGDALRILNDDPLVVHHAFIEDAAFKFDSGEQHPGRHVDIIFPVAGQFTVRCGIHPKMRLNVAVGP